MANSDIQIELPFSSRYHLTRLFQKDGKIFWGLWQPPEIQMDGDEEVIVVDDAHAGGLGLYAHEYYGDPELFWVIAHVNKIDYPPEDVVKGLQIVIPKKENVLAALIASRSEKSGQ
jgi:hypothetical protein